MKPGLGSAKGRVWRIRVRAVRGVWEGERERRWAIMRVAERDFPMALEGMLAIQWLGHLCLSRRSRAWGWGGEVGERILRR